MVCSASMMSSPTVQQRSTFTPRIQIKSRALKASPRTSRQVTRALSDTNLIISGATGLSLALGRFVFLDFQRDNVSRQGLPEQNGITYVEAGDKLSEEASFLKSTNDPAGFNLVDVFAWGAIGHIFGYAALAIISLNSLGVNPAPKF
ncbi:hypothetical protein ABBQ38_010150 [Trebouxia sp. C0009 RCD-2024]